MTKKEALQLFEEKKIRSVWDDKEEKWYFSVVDVVEALTDSADGKKRRCMAADPKGIFRHIQSIPSPKAEPFKMWMAQVASTRLEQMQDRLLPQLGSERQGEAAVLKIMPSKFDMYIK